MVSEFYGDGFMVSNVRSRILWCQNFMVSEIYGDEFMVSNVHGDEFHGVRILWCQNFTEMDLWCQMYIEMN